MWKPLALAALIAVTLAVHAGLAQTSPPTMLPGPIAPDHVHHDSAGMARTSAPVLAGQDAFAAIAEVVRILDADPNTDWSRVDLERLRQHLIDMSEVVLRSTVKQSAVAGGLAMEVTGAGRTEQAIRAMVVPHAAELAAMGDLAATTELIPGGVRLTVTMKQADERSVARLRALGFAGLLTLGAHHGPHHLAMARGDAIGPHRH
jgi:hypothetical protein